jgi:CheY-like chemotaxis protein
MYGRVTKSYPRTGINDLSYNGNVMAAERKNRILIVEDDADTRYALAMLFELEGFEVTSAEDGQEAYLLAVTKQPDIIVTDINMPRVSGLDLIRIIKEDGRLASVPIVAMSAVERQQLNRAKELGAVAVCQKPIEFDKFISMIFQVVSSRHRRSRSYSADRRRKSDREKKRLNN